MEARPASGSAPFAPEMVRVLDRLASRYGTDPWSVLQWAPDRLGLALACADAADADATRRIAAIASGGGLVFPVVDLGR